MERDQPSPTHSDGELRDMVDPTTQLDQGGNPLQEGIWANTDGGWQPAYRRDETFAKVQPMSSHDPAAYISMEPHMPWWAETPKESATKESFGPLLALGGRMLLAQALGGLMRGAIHGAGNFLQTPQPEAPYGGAAPVNMVASVHEAVGVDMPVESPASTPRIVEDHDPEAVDQQEFNDGDMSPAGNNPLLNGEAGGSQNPAGGEDGVVQKLEFRHDGDGVTHAEMLLPTILEYLHSDKSALENPQIKALHEQLDKEIPGYLDHADPNAEEVRKLMEALKHQSKTAAPVYQTTPINPSQMQMGNGQMAMPGTFQNPVQPGGMPVSGKCQNCGGTLNADGSCPQCGASAGANAMGNMEQPGHLQTPGIMPSPYAQRASHTAADHQGPITPEQKEVFAQYLIQQGRNDEVAAMFTNPALYADEWAQFINKSTQPPTVDPNEQPPAPPQPQMDPSQMGQMPVPGMSIPQPTAAADTVGTDNNPRRCPACKSATTTPMNSDGDMRCHRCGNIWQAEVMEDHPVVSRWKIVALRDQLNEATNPIDAPAADATAPGDRADQQDSSLSWQSSDGTPLQVGGTYEMHNPGYAIPDIIKVQQVKPDSIVVTMEGQYNAPSDATDPNDPAYTHEISLQEAQTEGLTFNPVDAGEGDQEQSQDQADQDGIGQTVNTQPVEQPHSDFPVHSGFQRFAPLSEYDQYFGGEPGSAAKAKAAMIKEYGQEKGEQVFYATVNKKRGGGKESATLPTDHCPKCDYGHVTSSYLNPETIQYECFRCANRWVVADENEDVTLDEESRAWLQNDDDSDPIGFDPRVLAMASTGVGRNIHDIAQRDPRNAQISERLNAAREQRVAGAKFSPREQKMFIDEDGVARNADRLNLEGTHYVESAFDNSKARPDRVNDNYLGLGL